MSSEFIHVVAYVRISSFLRLNNILLYVYFVHSFINENLESFHLLAIVNDAAINMWVHVSVGDPAFNSFGYILKSRIARSYDNPF